jgi:hypothetical protein
MQTIVQNQSAKLEQNDQWHEENLQHLDPLEAKLARSDHRQELIVVDVSELKEAASPTHEHHI